MLCQNCGASLNEGEKYCSECGAPIAEIVTPSVDETASVPQVPYAPVRTDETIRTQPVDNNGYPRALAIMILAILGLCFGLWFLTSEVGLALSIVARALVGSFRRSGYQIGGEGLYGKAKTSGKYAKAGNIISVIGLIVSIVMLVIYVIVLVWFYFNAQI